MLRKIRKYKRIVKGVSFGLLVLLIGSGAYYLWKSESNKLPDGIFQLVSAKHYSSQAKTWMEGKPGYGGTELKDFLIVKDLEIKDHTFFTFESSYGSFDNVSPFDFETDNNYKVAAWSKTLTPIRSVEEFDKETQDLIQKYFQTSQKALDQMASDRVELYQRRFEGKIVYEWDGQQLTLTFTNQKGDRIEEQVYRRLSSKEAQDLEERYQKAVDRYKGNKS